LEFRGFPFCEGSEFGIWDLGLNVMLQVFRRLMTTRKSHQERLPIQDKLINGRRSKGHAVPENVWFLSKELRPPHEDVRVWHGCQVAGCLVACQELPYVLNPGLGFKGLGFRV
jgi:hypothetical protein